MKGLLQALRGSVFWSVVILSGLLSALEAKQLEYNTPVSIRAQQFNRSLAVRAEFADMKSSMPAAPFEVIAVADEHAAAKDGSAVVVFKSAAHPDKTGPIQFNEICTIEFVKAGTGAWSDKTGFFPKQRLMWTFPGSKWNEKNEKDAPHFQPRVSDDSEAALKTDATHFAITSPAGKIGPVEEGTPVNIVSRASGASNNRLMWVLNLDQSGVLPVLISSDDPWGRDPKSGLGGDRRIEAGKFTIGTIDPQLLNEEGWADLAKVVTTGKAKPGGKYAAGGRSFVYEPAIFGKGGAVYSEQWKGEKPGTVWAKVRARAKSDIMIYVSTQPKWMDAAGTYCFFFGAYKNTRSQIRKGTQVVMEVDIAKQGDPSALITGNGSMWDDYWVSVEQHDDGKAVLTAGKGPKVGENVKMSWTDEQPLKFVQYVGLGGWDTAVEWEKIAQNGNEPGAKVPADFVQIPGSVHAIALALYDSQPMLYGISDKGSLLRWDSGSLKPNPWEVVETKDAQGSKLTKIVDVAAAADGAMALVSSKRRAYLFNKEKGYWEIIPNKIKGAKKKAMIDRIALGNGATVVGLDKKSKNIYLFYGEEWVLLSEGEGLDIAAGYDGSVYALNTKHELFSWEKGAWRRLETGLAFSMISAVSKDELYGIVLEGKKRKSYVFSKGTWEALQTAEGGEAVGLRDILAIPAKPPFVVALDEQGTVYRKGEMSVQLDDGVKKGVPEMPEDKSAPAGSHKKKKKKHASASIAKVAVGSKKGNTVKKKEANKAAAHTSKPGAKAKKHG